MKMMMMDAEKRTWEAKTRGKGRGTKTATSSPKENGKGWDKKPLKEEKTLITGLVRTTDE
jgi:hypothetical protein